MIAQTGKELPRGCGATTAQVEHAQANAVYVLPGEMSVDRAVKAARPDLELLPRSVLTPQGRYRLQGLAIGREVVIDHAIALAPDECAFLENVLAVRQRVTTYRDLPQHVRDGVAERYRASLPQQEVGAGMKITLDVRPWDDAVGAALTVRDEGSRQIGVLRLSAAAVEGGPTATKKRATEIVERIAALVNGDANHRPADLMPRDR